MFENYTYESILKSILDRISEADPTIDIREGSAMWYAVAPVAAELAVAYINYDAVAKESFVGTATREGMYRACDDIGINTAQFEATSSVFNAHFNVEVNIGSRWACGDYIFVAESKVGTVRIGNTDYFQYRLVCETPGSHTRYTLGNLIPITEYGSNRLNVAVLDECIVPGEDEASDEEVRATYFDYVANKPEASNVAQYHLWLNEFEGVGAHKIVPTWNGANTVKVVILDEMKESPTPELITSVQNYLDPNSEGLGEGKAPIGAVVTVAGGTNAHINVKAKITLTEPDADFSDIKSKLTDYFRKIAFLKSVVNVYEVASAIMSSPSVLDITEVKLGRWVNDNTNITYTTSNLTLGDFEIPLLHDFIKE